MNYQRYLILPAILAISSPALAQGKNGAMHSGRAAGQRDHVQPGQGQQHPAMTPEMMHRYMMEQYLYEQWLLNEMLGPPAPRGGHGRSKQHAGHSQADADAPQSSGGQQQPRSKAAGALQQPGSSSSTSGQTAPSPTRRSAKHKAHERTATRRDQQERTTRKTDSREHLLRDERIALGLLQTVYARLGKADADYAGHRVQAMQHIATAIGHLRGTALSGLSPDIGAGNGSQSRSDQILRDAVGTLNEVALTLGRGTNATEHHVIARAAVGEAIEELRLALEVR
jgi:hypothetical protein